MINLVLPLPEPPTTSTFLLRALAGFFGRPLNISPPFCVRNDEFCEHGHFQSDIQRKTAGAILKCKTGALGCNASRCDDCGYTELHNNYCRNRNCPNCQAVLKEVWVDKRKVSWRHAWMFIRDQAFIRIKFYLMC